MPFYKKINDYWQVIDAGAFEGSSVYKNIDGEWTPMNSMWVKKDDTWVQVYQKPAFVKDRSKTIAFLGDEHIWGWNLKDSDCIDNIIQQNLLTVDGGPNRTNFYENSNMASYSLNSDDNEVYNYGYDGRSRSDSVGTIYKFNLFTDEFDKNYTNTGVYSGFKGDKIGKTGSKNDWRNPEINISAGKDLKFIPSYYSSRLNICTKGTFKATLSKRKKNYDSQMRSSSQYIVTGDLQKFYSDKDFAKGKIVISYENGEIKGFVHSYFDYLRNGLYFDSSPYIFNFFKDLSYDINSNNYTGYSDYVRTYFENFINNKLSNNPSDTQVVEPLDTIYAKIFSYTDPNMPSYVNALNFKIDFFVLPDITGESYSLSFDCNVRFVPTQGQPSNNIVFNNNDAINILYYRKSKGYVETIYDECESIDDGVKEFSLKLDEKETNDTTTTPSELYLSVTSGNMTLKALQTGVHIPISPASEQSSIQIQRIARKYYAVEDYADDNVINEIKDNIMYKTYYDDAGIGNAVPTVVIQAGMNDIYRAHKKILNENGFLNKTMSDAEILDYTTNYFSNTYENNLRKLISGLYLTDGPNPHIPIVDVVLTVPFYPSNWFYWSQSTSNLDTAKALRKGSAFNNIAIKYYDETGNGLIIPNYKLLFKLHDELKRITYQLANEYYLHLVDLSTVFLLPYHFQSDGLYLNAGGAVRVANKYIDDLGLLQTFDYAYTSVKSKREYIYYKRKI